MWVRGVKCEVGVGWMRIVVNKCDVSGCTYVQMYMHTYVKQTYVRICVLSIHICIYIRMWLLTLLFIVFRTEGPRNAEHSCSGILSGLEAHVQPSQVSSKPTLHCYNHRWSHIIALLIVMHVLLIVG